jgi:hypothetical protein
MTTEIIAGRMGLQKKCVVKLAAKVDLIIVGDKGRNTFSSLLVGMLGAFNHDLEIPLWIVK